MPLEVGQEADQEPHQRVQDGNGEGNQDAQCEIARVLQLLDGKQVNDAQRYPQKAHRHKVCP